MKRLPLLRWLLERLGVLKPPPPASPGPETEAALTLGARAMKLEASNVVAVARREYLARARTRTFRITTALLVVASIAVALAPVLIRWIDRSSGPTKVEVFVGDAAPTIDVPATLAAVLNAASTPGGTGQVSAAYSVALATDEAAARARVQAGETAGVLIVSRDATTGLLRFDFVTKARAVDRISGIMPGAARLLATQDVLGSPSVSPDLRQKLQSPIAYSSEQPSGEPSTDTAENFINEFAIGFVLSIVLFMAIILYGQWIAFSVAEEKSSRVMEVILGAASPFELLAGKVIGVGGLALTQYAIIFLPALVVVLLQDQIAGYVLGEPAAAAGLPPGLSVGLLVTFGLLFVLGFGLYSVLYAGVASLVSRTEDINNMVAPLTLVSTAGYLVAVYSSTGIFPADSPLVTVMSYIPFFSPYLVLARMGSGQMGPLEVIVSVAILALTIPVALWVAARLYAAGVLMYGQRPSLRLFARVFRRA